MTRCCSNIFLNQFTQQPPDVIVDPPGASLCYHYEDVEFAGSAFDYQDLTMDYVTVDGVQTLINKTVLVALAPGDWGYDFLSFFYGQVTADLSLVAAAAGVVGMGFFIATNSDAGTLCFRFSVTGDGVNSCSITYTYNNGGGPVQVTTPLAQSNCDVAYGCYEATYTPEAPFLIENGNIVAITNEGLTLFETLNIGPPCPAQIIDQAWQDAFQYYIQTLHGTQSSVAFAFNGNTLTLQILNTLLVPAHMDNRADSGCTPPNSLESQNLFTEIDCP